MSRIDHKAFTPGQEGAYKSWMAMRQRCKSHRLYAGKVRICERWSDFYAFLEDMGERPDGMSIDRFPNNHGDYEPGNCRWATQKQQIENSEQVRGIEHLSRNDAEEIRRRFADGEAYQDLAVEFNRSQVNIHKIARGTSFRLAEEWTAEEIAEAQAAINAMRRRDRRPNKESP